MPLQIEIAFFVFLLLAGFTALKVRDLLAAVVSLTVFSFVSALLFVAMGAVDVGFTEAIVGAGVIGVLFVVAIYQTTNRSVD